MQSLRTTLLFNPQPRDISLPPSILGQKNYPGEICYICIDAYNHNHSGVLQLNSHYIYIYIYIYCSTSSYHPDKAPFTVTYLYNKVDTSALLGNTFWDSRMLIDPYAKSQHMIIVNMQWPYTVYIAILCD